MMQTRFFPLLALAALGACTGGTVNRGVESVHQPVVSRTDYVFDVPSGGLGPAERARLGGWLSSLRLAYGDRVSVDDGGDRLTRRDVQEVVGDYGLLLEEQAPLTEGERLPGTARVVVSRATATVPGCPDWSRGAGPDYANNNLSNYGCATNTNLAMMVANAQDLVEGRVPRASVDAATSAKAIKSYREKAPTGAGDLKAESTKGGR